MDGAIQSLMESSPTIAIALLWIYSERKDKQQALKFYRQKIEECQTTIQTTLDRVMTKSTIT